MLEPTVPRGLTEWFFGCTSVEPDPLMTPTGLAMRLEDVGALLDLLCRILSTVFSMKTRLFLIISVFVGELFSVKFFCPLSLVPSSPPP